MEIQEGEILGLIGPNGSGKTTIFNMVTGLYTPTSGDVYFEGESLLGRQPYEIARRGVARTFQSNRLCLDLSVLDNLFIGMHYRQQSWLFDAIFRRSALSGEVRRAREKALELLDIFNPELVDRAGDAAGDLPQIDRRRVEVCRAMAVEPRLLLLDEPSAGMTPEETEELMADIKKVQQASRGISIIIIEHDMKVISSITDRVVALNYGRKIAEGTYQAVAATEEVREAYLGKRGHHL
jgi:ABC-type branched-subunit amino acid transport system ATPase component